MMGNHDKKGRKVAEPVQVYLDPVDRRRLEWLTEQLDTTKSEVLRRALEALERQISDPESHPALRIMKIAEGVQPSGSPGYDVAVEHDSFLADSEVASWSGGSPKPAARKRGRRAPGKRGG
ncbi:MAG TPA: CopG family transcriptional regulator [Gemmatimonadaceae bacterium]|nr:CopG family transcriptional regulator [Gemmatimonadaceae bacterium]